MATVGIWKICSSLNQVINYTTNEEKTSIKNYKDLDNSLDYIKDDFKTEKRLFVDGINCDSTTALEEMVNVKKKFMKVDGILGWHAYHSFKEGEVTPELAHEVGLKVANEMWGDRFQVVVSTHINGKCIHNHFVINSVSFIDGKKYYGNRTTYAELRRISNDICSEYGLSTLAEKKTKSGINYLNYQNKAITYNNYYRMSKKDLDIAISEACSYKEFLLIMNNMGYEVTNRSGKLSIREKNYKRNIRIERYFGEDYTIENINNRINGLYISTNKNYYKKNRPQQSYLNVLLKSKYNSFYGIFIRYCNILNNYPNFAKKNYVSANLRKDLEYMELLSSHAIFLAANKIETEEQFFYFMQKKEKRLDDLKNSLEDIYKKRETTPPKKLYKKLYKVISERSTVREELEICESIRNRKDSIKKELEEIKERRTINNEYIK